MEQLHWFHLARQQVPPQSGKVDAWPCERPLVYRGNKWLDKWFVDFDKCIPYFGEALGRAICLAKCPWSTPGRAPKIMQKMLNRRTTI